eukprot:m.133133 g.133133  ORF g.133133 m.133133 type:complete len:259 (-) comp29655_c0_seq1:40-816(-)
MTDPPAWRSVISGSIGGVCATLVGHPFETVKVRLQTGQTTHLFKNLYAGIASPLVAVTPMWAFAYFSYRGTLKLLPEEWSNVERGMTAGAASGLLSVVLKTPVDAVKIVAQNSHVSAMQAARSLVKHEGMRGMYRGSLATLLYMTPSQAAFFGAYEFAQQTLQGYDNIDFAARAFLCGGIAGCVEWTSCFPGDVVKTRCQAQPGVKMGDVWKQVFREQGIRGFYRGYLPTILRAFPANGAGFLGIELANRAMQDAFST